MILDGRVFRPGARRRGDRILGVGQHALTVDRNGGRRGGSQPAALLAGQDGRQTAAEHGDGSCPRRQPDDELPPIELLHGWLSGNCHCGRTLRHRIHLLRLRGIFDSPPAGCGPAERAAPDGKESGKPDDANLNRQL